jgi:hypothetical protein
MHLLFWPSTKTKIAAKTNTFHWWRFIYDVLLTMSHLRRFIDDVSFTTFHWRCFIDDVLLTMFHWRRFNDDVLLTTYHLRRFIYDVLFTTFYWWHFINNVSLETFQWRIIIPFGFPLQFICDLKQIFLGWRLLSWSKRFRICFVLQIRFENK